jgi:hypothetical protein
VILYHSPNQELQMSAKKSPNVVTLNAIENAKRAVAVLINEARPLGPLCDWKGKGEVSSRGKWLLRAIEKLEAQIAGEPESPAESRKVCPECGRTVGVKHGVFDTHGPSADGQFVCPGSGDKGLVKAGSFQI